MTFQIISGSWPPDICGVGDFSQLLAGALREDGQHVKTIRLGKWNIWAALRATFGSYARNTRVILMYPTEGYGYSVLPFLLALGHRDRTILYCHEYASKNKYCRLLLRLFKGKNNILFGNEYDKKAFEKDTLLSDLRQGWYSTGIPSNILVRGKRASPDLNSTPIICHFGQIRPGKGLEDLLAVFQNLRAAKPEWHLRLIGGYPVCYTAYASHLSEQFAKCGTELILNKTSEEVSQMLIDSSYFVSLFPGGPCERRGSLMAAFAHGLLCFSSEGERTPDCLRDVMFLHPIMDRFDAKKYAAWMIDVIDNKLLAEKQEKITKLNAYKNQITFANISRRLCDVAK